ncbi:MAG: putative metal-dependent hydrolase [Alphaproteobacteria bacterium]|nr:putative metal-dependent hydrolase [Alphaproteobacteria bacterium]
MKNVQYPIGAFKLNEFSILQKNAYISIVADLPIKIQLATEGLSASQLQTPYRDGGWTVHELVHHIFDSHIQAMYRFKLALTEDSPTIKPYNEKAFVKTADVIQVPISSLMPSLKFFHEKWVILLKSIQNNEWETRFVIHPEKNIKMSLYYMLGLYAWHSLHHTAHITELRQAKEW